MDPIEVITISDDEMEVDESVNEVSFSSTRGEFGEGLDIDYMYNMCIGKEKDDVVVDVSSDEEEVDGVNEVSFDSTGGEFGEGVDIDYMYNMCIGKEKDAVVVDVSSDEEEVDDGNEVSFHSTGGEFGEGVDIDYMYNLCFGKEEKEEDVDNAGMLDSSIDEDGVGEFDVYYSDEFRRYKHYIARRDSPKSPVKDETDVRNRCYDVDCGAEGVVDVSNVAGNFIDVYDDVNEMSVSSSCSTFDRSNDDDD